MTETECLTKELRLENRLPFASEVVLSEVADMYPASHEGVLRKLIFHRGFAPALAAWWFGLLSKAKLSLRAGCSLQTSHPVGTCPHHDPAFGLGELQEGGTTL
jgi:hypothetical protein